MKIAYIIPSLEQGGPTNVLHDLVEVMTKHGHTCVVYYFDKKDKEQVFSCSTVHIKLLDSIDYSHYDIIHTHGLRPDIYNFIHKPLFKRALSVSTIHNFVFQNLIIDYGYLKGIVGSFIWLLARMRSDRLIVLNSTAFSYYRLWFGSDKLRIVYNTRVLTTSGSIPINDSNKFAELRKEYRYICCSICKITAVKGIDQIIKAISKIDENICYVIIGDGSGRRELEELVLSLNITDRVLFWGYRDNGYLYLPYIDVFCMPSHSEGFPLAMLEAAAYGKAIVASDIPVFKEIFNNDEIMICKENDINSYVEGINKLIPELKEYGKKAKKKFEKYYSPKAFYQAHINLYNELIKELLFRIEILLLFAVYSFLT